MVTCPNCGRPVPEGQKFCGSCGAEVQTAQRSAAPSEDQESPYAYPSSSGYGQSGGYGQPGSYGQSSTYGQSAGYGQSGGYGNESQYESEPPASGRMIVIAGALILAVCCAFACGLVFGFEIIPDVAQALGFGGTGATPVPTPRFTPTPSGLLPVIRYFIG